MFGKYKYSFEIGTSTKSANPNDSKKSSCLQIIQKQRIVKMLISQEVVRCFDNYRMCQYYNFNK